MNLLNNNFQFTLLLMILIMGCNSEPKEIARVPYSNGHCILRDDGMVVIECSGGRDMLPITLVSQELIDAFTAQLEAKNEIN